MRPPMHRRIRRRVARERRREFGDRVLGLAGFERVLSLCGGNERGNERRRRRWAARKCDDV